MKKTLAYTFFIFFLFSCGGGGGSSDGQGGGTNELETEKIRFLNAIKSEDAINVQLGTDVFIEEIAYGDASSFVEAQEGSGDNAIPLRVLSVEKVLPILTADQDIASGAKATYFLYDEDNVAALKVLEENATKPLPGEVKIRFINASEDKQSLDVYLVLPDEGIKDEKIAIEALAFKDASSYVSFRAGTFDIVYAEAGTSKIVRRAKSITFDQNKIYTHMVLDNIGSARGQTSRIFEDTLF